MLRRKHLKVLCKKRIKWSKICFRSIKISQLRRSYSIYVCMCVGQTNSMATCARLSQTYSQVGFQKWSPKKKKVSHNLERTFLYISIVAATFSNCKSCSCSNLAGTISNEILIPINSNRRQPILVDAFTSIAFTLTHLFCSLCQLLLHQLACTKYF